MNDLSPTGNPPQDYQEVLERDTHSVPQSFIDVGEQDVGPLEVPTSWFLDREIHEREIERIWKKSWQMACRVDDVAEVGDTFVYDVATLSILIVRSGPDTIKAFHNSCLHRGRPLRDCPGNVSQLKCPYHGYTWALDGALRGVPAREEFPTVNNESFRLPEVQVGIWGGFVFINPDPNAIAFEEHLGILPEEYRRWPLDNRVRTVHISAAFDCNWKVAQDAFLEAFHVEDTHPQLVLAYGNQYHRLDVFGNVSRGVLGSFFPSQNVRWKPNAQEMFNSATGAWDDEAPMAEIGENVEDIRATVASMYRDMARPGFGDKVDELSDAEMVDVIWYSIFPNLSPFANALGNLVYRFRPDGDNHLRSIMDIMMLVPWPEGERPKPAKERRLRDDETFADAPELGFIAPILVQDSACLNHMTRGLRNNQRGKIVLAKHHELKLRHFYQMYAEQMDLPLEA